MMVKVVKYINLRVHACLLTLVMRKVSCVSLTTLTPHYSVCGLQVTVQWVYREAESTAECIRPSKLQL